MAQTSSLQGTVKGEDGQPVKDALIKIDRKDIKGHYQVKTKKKGDYFHTGLPLGVYKITLEVDGKDVDFVDNVRTSLGEPKTVDFNMQDQKQRSQSLAKAAETGNITPEQARDMTPAQKAAIEKQMKDRSAQLSKRKELNDAFNQGMEALKAKQFDVAIQSLTKAVEMDPTQNVIWGNLAEAYGELSKTKTGAEQQAAFQKTDEAYKKAIEIAPTDPNYHNNFAIALAREKKFPEMEAELKKAVELDPAGAGRYYFNLGAVLVNNNQTNQACDAFQQAIKADANYADAYYQYGICLTSKATNTPDGKVIFPEGTAPAFQKYLELKPDGPYAESAKGILSTMGSTIDTKYIAPGAKKGSAPAKKK
jgi:Tfp pilus assembly protein PilF